MKLPLVYLTVAVASLLQGQATDHPKARFGFGVSCSQCEWVTSDSGAWFRFSSPPEIIAVEAGSPAAHAGLAAGDILTAIDGVPLTSDAGGRRMANASPGQRIQWTFQRGGRERLTQVTAAASVDAAAETAPAAPALRAVATPVRFAGSFADVDIEVRGAPTVSVLMADGECWMEVRTRDARVRLRQQGPCHGSSSK